MKKQTLYQTIQIIISNSKPLLAIVFFCLLTSFSFSQDMHFSQYYATPTLLNPATTGNFNGLYRVGLNYRTQWGSVTIPWRTFDIYSDLSIGKERFGKKLFFGAGIVLLRDQAGDGNLAVNKILLSGAIHYKINKSINHTISLGAHYGFIQKSIDWDKLYFNNQWNDAGFDRSKPSLENYSTSRISYSDAALGAVYQNNSEKKYSYYTSLALHHLLQPNETFYANGTNSLGFRSSINAGGSILLTDLISVSPSIQYMTQKKASEFLLGAMIGYDITQMSNTSTKIFAGIYNRIKDAWYPVVGLEYGPWRGFINYDINYSELKPFSNSRGAFELSLVYVGASKYKNIIDIPCPRF